MKFYTADTHFGHKNVIEYASRPYDTIEEMNESLVESWNSCVSPDDTIYHLGDVAFMSKTKTKEICLRLNGHKILILGNHDLGRKDHFWLECGFEQVVRLGYGRSHVIQDEPFPIFGCHYPLREVMTEYDDRDYLVPHAPEARSVIRQGQGILIHGHVHNSWKFRPYMLNVGVDVWNWRPVSHEELLDEYVRYQEENPKLFT